MTPGRVAAALIALAVLARALARYQRARIGRRKVAAWTALAAALVVYAAGVLPPLPSPERILGGVAGAIGPYAYVLVGAIAYLETAAFLGLITPGELSMLIGGVVAARGDVSIVPLIGLVWLCSVLGDSTGYLLGRRLGRSFLVRHGDRFHLGPERLERVEGFFDRRGGAAVVIARFVGPVRTIAPFVAGSSRMRYRRFLPYTLLGTGLWSTTFLLLGYFFYASFARVAELAGRTGGVLAAVLMVIGGSVYAYRRLRHPDERRRLRDWWATQSRRPVLRPVARVAGWLGRTVVGPLARALAGPARFVVERLTPGGLGIELTSTLAAAGVGLYVFGLYVSLIAPDPELLTPLDRLARSVVGVLPRGVLVEVAAVVTEAGSSSVTAAVVLVAALWLALRRRWPEAAALAGGFALVLASVNVAKVVVDRPRPAEALLGGEFPSYPSGHAAYAVTFVALSLVIARRASGAARPAAIVLFGVAVAALVGLTRVYLGAHHLSDVSGGWGLAAGVYGVCGAMAIVIGHLTPTEAPSAGAPGAPDDATPSAVPPEAGATLPARGTQG
ncbi:MAG: VTT domain-containing protein [Thermoleophilaceae bacterium]